MNINLLSGAIQSYDQGSAFDFDRDQVVDLRDPEYWVSQMARTVAGDANIGRAISVCGRPRITKRLWPARGWAAGDFGATLDMTFVAIVWLSTILLIP